MLPSEAKPKLFVLRVIVNAFINVVHAAHHRSVYAFEAFCRNVSAVLHRIWSARIPLCLVLVIGVILLSGALMMRTIYNTRALSRDSTSPAAIMVEHSAKLLNQSLGLDNASIATLQDKLQLRQMQMDIDTQSFTATREVAKEMIMSACNLPDKICKSMALAINARESKFHKKSSVPLESNQGSYYAAWMWVKESDHEGEVQVAFKAASLSYHLRDVVTYRDQVEYEPVIKCETSTDSWLFSSKTTEHCREISQKKTVNSLPVFKEAIMSPEEMQLVDTMMESVLARKVLDNTNVGLAKISA